jgi:hypothetical protein
MSCIPVISICILSASSRRFVMSQVNLRQSAAVGCRSHFDWSGCARMPYTTLVVHEDRRVPSCCNGKSRRQDMRIRSRLPATGGGHPADFLREQQRLPLGGLLKRAQRTRSSEKTAGIGPAACRCAAKAGPEERSTSIYLPPVSIPNTDAMSSAAGSPCRINCSI